MASLTVRGLDDDVKTRLRVRAATHGISLEEEVRRILKSAVAGGQPATDVAQHWVDRITAITDAVGGFDLDTPPRGGDWQPPDFNDFPFEADETPDSDRGDR